MKVYISIPITGKDIDEQKRHAEDAVQVRQAYHAGTADCMADGSEAQLLPSKRRAAYALLRRRYAKGVHRGAPCQKVRAALRGGRKS